jgi:hypothetical protein
VVIFSHSSNLNSIHKCCPQALELFDLSNERHHNSNQLLRLSDCLRWNFRQFGIEREGKVSGFTSRMGIKSGFWEGWDVKKWKSERIVDEWHGIWNITKDWSIQNQLQKTGLLWNDHKEEQFPIQTWTSPKLILWEQISHSPIELVNQVSRNWIPHPGFLWNHHPS